MKLCQKCIYIWKKIKAKQKPRFFNISFRFYFFFGQLEADKNLKKKFNNDLRILKA